MPRPVSSGGIPLFLDRQILDPGSLAAKAEKLREEY
jgi:hypothetical protein